MKFSYDILPERHLAILRFKGSITLKDVLGGIRQLWADPRYQPAFDGIVDLEGVTTQARIGDITALIVFLQQEKSTSQGRWAAIFTEPKPTALALIFKVACHAAFTLEVVSTWEAACNFVRVQLPPLPAKA
jgi:hypothetical protein